MENINNGNKGLKDLNDNNIENIPRCPECNIIPSLELNYQENRPFINYECSNNHKGTISLEEYLVNYNKNSITREKCSECNKSQNEVKGDFSYCTLCNKFLCPICQINHPIGDKHNVTNFKRYDSLCKSHSYFFFFIVKNVKKIFVYFANQIMNHMN